MKKSSRVFITGATGFIGASLVHRLIADGHRAVHVLARKSSDSRRLEGVQSKIHIHEGDVTNLGSLRRVAVRVRPEYIFHFANAGLYGGVSLPDKKVLEINFFGLVNLLEALAPIPYKFFLNTGSSSEYGPKRVLMREDIDCVPENVYGISKLMATRYASFIGRTQKKPVVTFRLFSPFGPWDDPRRLIMQSISHFLRGNQPSLGNPKAVRDYIFIEDAIDLFLEAAGKAPRLPRGEVFNVGRGRQISAGEVVAEIANLTGYSKSLKWGSYHAHKESPVWRADMKKTFRAFSWRPRISLKKGLGKTVRWMGNVD